MVWVEDSEVIENDEVAPRTADANFVVDREKFTPNISNPNPITRFVLDSFIRISMYQFLYK